MTILTKNLILGIALALTSIGLVTFGSHVVTAGPTLTPFNFNAKECKVEPQLLNSSATSCKEVRKMIKDLHIHKYSLLLQKVGDEITITLRPAD